MSSNAKLREDIANKRKELGFVEGNTDLDTMTNKQLSMVLKGLNEFEPVADNGGPYVMEDRPLVTVVSKGKSVTCLKGIIPPGTEVSENMFAGGKDTIDDLLEKGYLIKK